MRAAVASRAGKTFATIGDADRVVRPGGEDDTSNVESARVSTAHVRSPRVGTPGGRTRGGERGARVDVEGGRGEDVRALGGWYEGRACARSCARCAVVGVAGTDRLDDVLTVAQMQGKFQTVLFPNAGHAVHEDEPERCAEAVLGFAARYASPDINIGHNRAATPSSMKKKLKNDIGARRRPVRSRQTGHRWVSSSLVAAKRVLDPSTRSFGKYKGEVAKKTASRSSFT